jgi:hypothetical protein
MSLRSRVHWSLLGTLATLVLALAATSAWALGPGAPPDIKYVGMIVATTDDGAPRLRAELEVEIPGGAVPLNVASVTVTVPAPDGRTSSIPLGRSDLYPMQDYNLDLGTESGFSGGVFPAGTYVFTVTDTAGGTTTVTDNLGATTGLAAASSLTVSGAVPVSGQPGQPPTYLLNLATTPTPTVSWTPPAGALNQRLRIRGGFQDQNLFSRYTNDGTTSTMTLPAGIMVQGRRYVVQLDAFDHANPFGCSATPPCTNTNVRARRQIEVITPGPEIFLTFNSGNYSAGQMLDVTTRIYNTGPSITVNANAWVGLPGGGVVPILDVPSLTIPTSTGNPTGPNNFYSGSIGFSYTFTGTEPNGIYVVGLRLTDPSTGETVALATQTFRK